MLLFLKQNIQVTEAFVLIQSILQQLSGLHHQQNHSTSTKCEALVFMNFLGTFYSIFTRATI